MEINSRIMELPLPPEQKQLAKIKALADKARTMQEIIQDYEINVLTTADLQSEILAGLEEDTRFTDIYLLKAVKAIALMTNNMEYYRECLTLIIPRLKQSLDSLEAIYETSELEEFKKDVDKYKHYIMLAEQELSDL